MEGEEQRRSLAVWEHKEEFQRSVKENKIVILFGERGCGKSTQIPQFLLEALKLEDRNARWLIGCTQPCEAAAMSVSRRVAQEMGVEIGEEVGYKVPLEDHTSSQTVLKYMTDGMLVREAIADPVLGRYRAIQWWI